MKPVIDSSVVLALLLEEIDDEQLLMNVIECHVSTVNLIEILTRASDKGIAVSHMRTSVDRLRLQYHPLDHAQAVEAGELRNATRAFGLSLGDRACLALARTLGAPVLTADRAWADLDIGIDIRLIR